MAEPSKSFFTLNPRRKSKNLLLQPALQLKLPFYLLVLTLVFAGLFAAHGYRSYGRLLTEMKPPPYLDEIVAAQTSDFLIVCGVLTFVYALIVVGLSIVYAHRMVGPMVPFRRQLEALKNGDYSTRVHLRRGDAFEDVARELNELSELLERAEKPDPE